MVTNIDIQELDNLRHEAVVFANYLVNEPVGEDSIELYQRAIGASHESISKNDQKLLSYVRRHPRQLGFLESGLMLTNPHSELRRRLYIMFAILESTPALHAKFLSQKRNAIYSLVVIYSGMRSVFKTIIGSILIRAVI